MFSFKYNNLIYFLYYLLLDTDKKYNQRLLLISDVKKKSMEKTLAYRTQAFRKKKALPTMPLVHITQRKDLYSEQQLIAKLYAFTTTYS